MLYYNAYLPGAAWQAHKWNMGCKSDTRGSGGHAQGTSSLLARHFIPRAQRRSWNCAQISLSTAWIQVT